MLIVLAQNVSALAEVSDYEVEVRVNEKIIAAGKAVGHRRNDGWRALLMQIAESGEVDESFAPDQLVPVMIKKHLDKQQNRGILEER